MKALLLCAVAATLISVAAAANDYCVFTRANAGTGFEELVNISNAKPFDGDGTIYFGSTPILAQMGVSPCRPTQFASSTCSGLAWIRIGAQSACYMDTPITSTNYTSNTTSMTFLPSTNSTRSSFLFEVKPATLTLTFTCNPLMTDDLTFMSGSQNPSTGDVRLTFETLAACSVIVPMPTPTPTLPTPGPKGDDDDGKLSSWAIVGIVVGAVVVLVVIGVICFKCRKSDPEADGQYSRV